MRNLFFFLLCLFAGMSLQAQNVIYVQSNAPAGGNGSSWSTAFQSLNDALNAANPGDQVWVAAGAYKPAGGLTPQQSSFTVQSGVELYGGFAGNETSLAQRNWNVNPTVLSGDLANDDISNDLDSNRTDNVQHIVTVLNGNPTDRAVVDGFTIRNGSTSFVTTDPDLSQRGAGILVQAKLTVRNCVFRQNSGISGACISAINAPATGLEVYNCTFDNNFATSQSAGIYLRVSNGASIRKCTFSNNNTNRGCIYPQSSTNVLVDSCIFENNTAIPGTFAAGMFTWQTNFLLKRSIFRNNNADNGACMYNDGRENVSSFTIEDCIFENNTTNSAGFGGAGLYNWQADFTIRRTIFRNNESDNAAALYNDGREGTSSFTIDSCLFEANSALDFGGSAVYNFTTDFEIKNSLFLNNISAYSSPAVYNNQSTGTISDCTFDGGTATFGGAIANYNLLSVLNIERSTFRANTAETSGGAIINGFTATLNVNNCLFEANTAGFGGAIFNQNDSTEINVAESVFLANAAENSGGAISVSAGIEMRVDSCHFRNNSANFGGAINMEEDSLDLSKLWITQSEFIENIALTQAAGINISNADVDVENAIFAYNTNIGSGYAGAISNNADQGKTSNLKLVNCTVAYNEAFIAGGIAQWEDADVQGSEATMTLQNCIIDNLLGDYAVEDGTPSVISLGGNITTEGSLSTLLQSTNDQHLVDPLFVDPNTSDFHLLAGSPAINNGIATDAPTVDITGSMRIGAPDAGSYEWFPISVFTPSQALSLSVAPNPTVDLVRSTIQNTYQGTVQVQVVDGDGRVVLRKNSEKTGTDWQGEVSLGNMPAGVYRVMVQMGDLRYLGAVVRQ
ncbi:MAG: right-handed parallel beta-helix repeat-containing protein [Saprospiraceae bacterium]|nr:right-handed parallel beta-helix repeat-containing protein [Saprospiraceae bacterium]